MMNYEYNHKRYDNFGVISISIREYGGAYTDRQPCPFPRQLPGARALFSPHNHESTEVLYNLGLISAAFRPYHRISVQKLKIGALRLWESAEKNDPNPSS